MKIRSLLFLLLTAFACQSAAAQGFATWLGDRLGVGNAGKAIDKAHAEVKKAVPLYGKVEEGASGVVRQVVQESVVESTAPILKNYILASRNNALMGAVPLPPEVIWEFRGFFGSDVLSAKWNHGFGNDLSLQAGSFRFGDRAGIALDTVVVFRSIADAYDPWLWAHELAHIEQYRKWGVDDFTKRYIRDYQAIESAANARANEFMRFRQTRLASVQSVPAANMRSPLPNSPTQQQGNMCVTNINRCGWTGPIGWPCVCASPYGLQNGMIN